MSGDVSVADGPEEAAVGNYSSGVRGVGWTGAFRKAGRLAVQTHTRNREAIPMEERHQTSLTKNWLMMMSDGVTLAAELYRPVTDHPIPCSGYLHSVSQGWVVHSGL